MESSTKQETEEVHHIKINGVWQPKSKPSKEVKEWLEELRKEGFEIQFNLHRPDKVELL